jgi:hypothetical protein
VATGRVTQPAVEASELTADKAALRQPPAK